MKCLFGNDLCDVWLPQVRLVHLPAAVPCRRHVSIALLVIKTDRKRNRKFPDIMYVIVKSRRDFRFGRAALAIKICRKSISRDRCAPAGSDIRRRVARPGGGIDTIMCRHHSSCDVSLQFLPIHFVSSIPVSSPSLLAIHHRISFGAL